MFQRDLSFVVPLWVTAILSIRFCVGSIATVADFQLKPCSKDSECVQGGKCWQPRSLNHSTCVCFRTCTGSVPLQCDKSRHCNNGEEIGLNFCDKPTEKDSGRCLCPAEDVNKETCTKRDLRINYFNVSSDTPYQGEDISFSCCMNINPHQVFAKWSHNGTDTKRAGSVRTSFDKCSTLNVTNIQYKDSGIYTCTVSLPDATVQDTKSVPIHVRAPIIVLLNVTVLNSTALFAEWIVSPEINVGVTLQVRTVEPRTGNRVIEFRNQFALSKIVTDLKPATWYNVTVETLPFKGNRSASDTTYVQTFESKPGRPVALGLKVNDPVSRLKCALTWRPPEETNGRIVCYKVRVNGLVRWKLPYSDMLVVPDQPRIIVCMGRDQVFRAADVDCIKPEQFMLCQFEDLRPNRNYTAVVSAVNGAAESDESVFDSDCITGYSAPDSVTTPVAKKGMRNLTLDIEVYASDEFNGPISCYYLAIVPYRDNATAKRASSKHFRLPELMIFADYNKTMEILINDESDPVAYIAESFSKITENTIVIGDGENTGPKCGADYLLRHPSYDGPLQEDLYYTGFLIVKVDPDPSLVNSLSRDDSARQKRLSLFNAVYGYSEYFQPVTLHNGPTIVPGSDSASSQDYATQVVLPILLVLSLIIVLAAAWLYATRRQGINMWCLKQKFLPRRDSSFAEIPVLINDVKSYPPIMNDKLPAEYLKRHRDSDFLFRDEFESLPHNKFDTHASDRPENAHKNRYNDIKAYDVTRVKLNVLNGEPSTDYINANYVQGYKGRRRFIAAQGPKEDTAADFWRMIFEQNISIVVMVTNLQEKYRTMCYKYWPDTEPIIFKTIEVEPLESANLADYSVRKFRLTPVINSSDSDNEESLSSLPLSTAYNGDVHNRDRKSGRSRVVVQYHYTGWYDYRAPDCTVGLLRFITRLRRLEAYSNSLICAHCSAGVGRTGTFVAIDAMMDQMQQEGRVDIFGFVSAMRRERNFMVQSLEQYVFVYKALSEWFLFGDTDVEVERIHEHVRLLRDSATEIGNTEMKMEFLKLSQSLEDQKTCDFANREVNLLKNRYQEFVPYDRNRVILSPQASSHTDASYINASVIQGYHRPYILAQDPLPRTVADFWRMIWEHDVATIVMLSSDSEILGAEIYWPEEPGKGLLFGDRDTLGIQLIQVEESSSCVVRRLNLTNNKEKAMREVQQFAYRDWPAPILFDETAEDESSDGAGGDFDPSAAALIPRRTASFLDLIGKAQQRQRSITASGPVVVHCRTGAQRSGLYCAVSLLLERVKAEGRVDIFQTVKTLRAQRAHVLESLAQYEFCYQSVLDYLEPFR